jgi:fibronectin type 3 domain-containing protein
MKQGFILFVCLIAFSALTAQVTEPMPEILNLTSMINVDSMQTTVQHLQDYQTRHPLAGNQLQIATWLSDKFQSYGFSNTYLQQYQKYGTTQYNVIATIPGYLYPERYILVTAHYDSQSLNSPNNTWAPGADDNASGTAGILEMARVMKQSGYQPRCTIRFIALSAEEIHMALGSEAYCDYALSENHDIRLMLNLDMIGSNDPISNEFRVVPFSGFLAQAAEVKTIVDQYSLLQPVDGILDWAGDGINFSQAGFPSVMFIERYLSPYWHSGEDLIDHLDFQYALQIMHAATATAAVFANQPQAPEAVSVLDTGTGNSLLVQWNSVPDAELSHYAVYFGTQVNDLAFWQNVTESQCQISGLEEGQYYHIAVKAMNSAGYFSIPSYSGETPQSIPRVPQLEADYPAAESITITWIANTELDLAGYRVYRKLGPDGELSMIGNPPAFATSFTDTQVASNLDFYYYQVSAIDNQYHESSLSEALSSRMVSLDRGIYVIDESKNFPGTNPFLPADEAVDDFYAGLVEGFEQISHLDLEEYGGTLRVADIGIYSSILWHGNDNTDITYPFGLQEVFRQYVYWGGQLLFSVYFPGKAFEMNAGYPAAFPPESFISEVLGISGVDYSPGARFKTAIPGQANYPGLEVDPLKTLAAWEGHIYGVEALQPVDPESSIYLFGSDYAADSNQGILNGSAVGIRHQYGAGQVICLSFPLYNMDAGAATAFANYVFGTLFNETSAVQDPAVPPIAGLTLQPNHPNPFTRETTFRVQTPKAGEPLQVGIYNLRGQLVQRLHSGPAGKDQQFVWDGRDAGGKPAGSGIYFIKAGTARETAVAKILKL